MSSWPSPQPERSWWRLTPPLTPGRGRAAYRAAPPASRLLRIACGDGLRPALTPEPPRPPGGRKPRARPTACPRPARDPRHGRPLDMVDHGKGQLPAMLQRPLEPAGAPAPKTLRDHGWRDRDHGEGAARVRAG